MTYLIQIDGEVREANLDEIAMLDAQKAEAEAQAKASADRAKLKADTLIKLGLTADEVSALLS